MFAISSSFKIVLYSTIFCQNFFKNIALELKSNLVMVYKPLPSTRFFVEVTLVANTVSLKLRKILVSMDKFENTKKEKALKK